MIFSRELITWYESNKRDLPWRDTTDPYRIWMSEIILQQTRVNQGKPYYYAFLDAFPTVADLAEASEDDVLKLWQGLGYYSRARNLHYTAKYIMEKHLGVFPSSYNEILKLKGVGLYTAAAISSFAFNLPYAVVDGNVTRLLSRYFGVDIPIDSTNGKKVFQDLADSLLIKSNPAIYNQAIMEFGALQCVPKSPDCLSCPISDGCFAFAHNKIDFFPVKKSKIKVRSRYLHFLIIHQKGEVFIKKRTEGIWNGLYEFPFLEFTDHFTDDYVVNSLQWKRIFNAKKTTINKVSDVLIHQLSHQKLYAKFWHIQASDVMLDSHIQVPFEKVGEYPLSRLIDKYLLSLV